MLVTTETQDGIATVTLHRPDKKNAMSLDLLAALVETCGTLKETEGLRAVILTGAGGVFSAGIDITMMMTLAGKLGDIKAMLADPDETGA